MEMEGLSVGGGAGDCEGVAESGAEEGREEGGIGGVGIWAVVRTAARRGVRMRWWRARIVVGSLVAFCLVCLFGGQLGWWSQSIV